jgi:hypothetical protein
MDKTYTFQVDLTSDLIEKTYKGPFTLRHANLMDIGAISATMSRLNQGVPFVSNIMEAIITAVATITVCVESAPEWWAEVSDGDMIDTKLIMQINTLMLDARRKSKPFRSDELIQDETII